MLVCCHFNCSIQHRISPIFRDFANSVIQICTTMMMGFVTFPGGGGKPPGPPFTTSYPILINQIYLKKTHPSNAANSTRIANSAAMMTNLIQKYCYRKRRKLQFSHIPAEFVKLVEWVFLIMASHHPCLLLVWNDTSHKCCKFAANNYLQLLT